MKMLTKNTVIVLVVALLTGFMLVGSTVYMHGGMARVIALGHVPERQQGPRNAAAAQQVSASKRVIMEHAELAREAYTYARPLLDTYRQLHEAITEPSSARYIGAFNSMRVQARVEGEADQTIDVSAWLDLRTEPMLFHLPGKALARTAVELVDLRGRRIAEISVQEQEGRGLNYLVVSTEWEGELPLGVERTIRSSTDLVQLRSFTRVGNAMVFEYIKAWGEKIVLVPLSAYTMNQPPEPAVALKLPQWDERKATTVQFIPYLNFMLRFIHARGDELAQLQRFRKIGIVEGLPRAPREYGGAISAGIGWALRDEAAHDTSSDVATIGQI